MRYKLLIFIVLLIPNLLLAQTNSDPDTLKVYHLGEIYVTAKRIYDQPTTIVELEETDIEDKNAETVSEAIADISGLFVSTGGKNSTEVSIRGSDSKDVLIMVDGRPINETYYGKLDLDMLPVDNIERIKVVKGTASVLYGPNAKGGVINIITKTPRTPEVNVHTRFSENNTYKLELSNGFSFGDVNYWLTYSKSKSDGYTTPEDELVSYSDYDNQNITGKVVYNPLADTQIGISAGFYTAEKGIPHRNWRFTDWQRRYVDITGNHRLRPGLTVKGKFYIDSYYNDLLMDEYFDEGRELSRHDNYNVGGNVSGEWSSMANNRLDWNLILRHEIFGKQTLEPDVIATDMEKFSALTTSFALQDEFQPRENIRLMAGVLASLMTSDDFDEDKTSIDPTIGINYHPMSNLALRLNFSKTTRFPTLHNLYSSSSGNPDLEDEDVYKMEFSTSYAPMTQLGIEVALFRRDIRNMIYRRGKGWTYRNIAEAYTQGIELGIDMKPIESITLSATYSYLDSKDKEKDRELDLVPNHKLNSKIVYQNRFGTRANVSYMYVGERIDDGFEMEPYSVVNAKVNQKLLGDWEIFVAVENIADASYEEEKDWQQKGRTFSGGINWKWRGM